MIIATFDGSGAYYGSTETTYLAVSEAEDMTPPECDLDPVLERIDAQNLYIYILIVLVIIAILLAIYCLMKCRK